METVSVRDARRQISRLLDAVQAGEEAIITGHGKPVARKLRILEEKEKTASCFPDRSALRNRIPASSEPASRTGPARGKK